MPLEFLTEEFLTEAQIQRDGRFTGKPTLEQRARYIRVLMMIGV